MNKLHISFCLFILGFSLLAQETQIDRKWRFGAEVFSNYSFINSNSHNEFLLDGSSYGGEKISLSGRATAERKLKNNFSFILHFGMQFTGEKVYMNYINPFAEDPEDMSSFGLKYRNITNLQLSAGANYSISDRFYLHNAVSVLSLVSYNLSDKNFYKEHSENSFYSFLETKTYTSFSYQLGAGYNFILHKNSRYYVQPMVELIFRNNNKSTKYSDLTKMIGIVVGANF